MESELRKDLTAGLKGKSPQEILKAMGYPHPNEKNIERLNKVLASKTLSLEGATLRTLSRPSSQRLGDDADTVGAVTGQIAGAAWGVEAIPPRWLEKLAWRERITNLSSELADLGS